MVGVVPLKAGGIGKMDEMVELIRWVVADGKNDMIKIVPEGNRI